MLVIIHFFFNLSLRDILTLGGILDEKGFFGDSEEMQYLFAVDGALSARLDGVIE